MRYINIRLAAIALTCMTGLVFYSGCMVGKRVQEKEVVQPLRTSSWGGNYAYTYTPTGPTATKSVDVTIAVVDPAYREQESALFTPLYAKVGKGFSASMGTDLDKILIAKRLTTTGPFPSLDEITYNDKKGAALTLAPKVFITTSLKYTGEPRSVQDGQNRNKDGRIIQFRQERDFRMVSTGWISFVMQEPLSGEKMWIKKLELEPVEVRGVEISDAVPIYHTVAGKPGLLFGTPAYQAFDGYKIEDELLYDGKVDAMADTLKTMYPLILDRFSTFLDSDEMLALKEKGKEIRALKVY